MMGVKDLCKQDFLSANCNEGTCYSVDLYQPCEPNEPDCYLWLGADACPNAYPLQTPCPEPYLCDGMKWGEYYVGVWSGNKRLPIYRGRVILTETLTDSKTEYCFHLPWGTIIDYASTAGAVDSGAVVTNPPYQVSLYHDFDFADGDDFFDPELMATNLTDYVPNVGYAGDASLGAAPCLSDSNGDCKANRTDLVQIKTEFNRSNCTNCCP